MVLLPPKGLTEGSIGYFWAKLFKATVELDQAEILWSMLIVNSMLLKYYNIA